MQCSDIINISLAHLKGVVLLKYKWQYMQM